jgi:hypothetical protein
MDVYTGASTTATSVPLSTIPTKRPKLYARLWHYVNGTWKYADGTNTEASQRRFAEIDRRAIRHFRFD